MCTIHTSFGIIKCLYSRDKAVNNPAVFHSLSLYQLITLNLNRTNTLQEFMSLHLDLRCACHLTLFGNIAQEVAHQDFQIYR